MSPGQENRMKTIKVAAIEGMMNDMNGREEG